MVKKKENLNWLFIVFAIAIVVCFCVMGSIKGKQDERLYALEKDIVLLLSEPDDFKGIFSDEYDYYWNCLGWSNENCSELVSDGIVFMPRGATESWCDEHCTYWSLRQQKKTAITKPVSAIIELSDEELEDLKVKKFKDFSEFKNSDIEVCLTSRVFFSDYFKVYDVNLTKEQIVEYVNSRKTAHKFEEIYCEIP